MQESELSTEAKLDELYKKLTTQSSMQQSISILQQIRVLLQTFKVEDNLYMKDLIIKQIKPISREITNINIRLFPQSKPKLEALLFLIVQIYAKTARYRFEVVAFQMLIQLLQRNTEFFKKSAQAESQQNQFSVRSKMQHDHEWITLRSLITERNNFFYYKCLNRVMQVLQGIQQQFPIAGLNFIRQYLSFLVKFYFSIKQSKLCYIASSAVQVLQGMMLTTTNGKDPPKQYAAESIRTVSDAGVKLGNEIRKVLLKKKFDMLASMYGLSLLSMNSIEKKLNAMKIMNKQSEHFYRSGFSSISDQQYVDWLFDNGIFQFIFEQSSQSPVIKNCNYIFRLLFKGRYVNQKYFNKLFDYMEATNSENRQFVLRQMQLESIRLNFAENQLLIKRLQNIQKPDYYEQDLFTIINTCVRYTSIGQTRQFMSIVGKILRQHFRKFKNEKVEHKCLKSYVKSLIKLIGKDNQSTDKKNQIMEVYEQNFANGFSQLGILIFKSIIQQLPQHGQITKSKTALFLIKQKNIISEGLKALKDKNITLGLQMDIEQFLTTLLKIGAEIYGQNKLQFKPDILLEALDSPKMLQKLGPFVVVNQQLTKTFQNILSRFQLQEISFEAVKNIFFRVNIIHVKQIREYNQQHRFQIYCKAPKLQCFDSLKYLLLNANNGNNRNLISDFISDLYTSYSEAIQIQGEAELENLLKQTLQMTINEYKSQQSETRLLGYLALIEYLMMGTEILGVGKYRPHNSLVPISTVQIKVNNDITYGNDVTQSFNKKVSSNLTLFDLLEEMKEKFRCSAYQIILQEGEKFWPQKWNGLTLQQLKIDNKLLKATKTSKQKIRKQKLIENGELTSKAKKAFQQIYKVFAVDGKMGKKECSNFVAAVTKTSSTIYDGRVEDFFKQYDLDKDQNLTLEDFYRFYKHHCTPQRDDVVWKNLFNMRFRRDLKKYDDPIQVTNQNLLFRSLIYQSQQFYNILLSLQQSKNKQIQQRSKRLLLRLPTFPKILQSMKSQLKLIEKNSFQTEYLLIAIQSKLNSGEQKQEERDNNQKEFISSGNMIQIFEMMLRIDKMEAVTDDQTKCLYISLQILRSLLKVPNLKSNIDNQKAFQINLELPQTYLLIKLAHLALKNIDIDIFQAAVALQLTQKQNQIQFCLKSIFHEEAGIRKICCNYIFIFYLQGKVKVDLFQIQQKTNCQYWFETLTKICSIDNKIDFQYVIKKCLQSIKNRKQTIEGNLDDPIIYGNLSIISSILSQKTDKKYADFTQEVIQISQSVLSNRSRRLIYSILAYFDVYFAIQFVSHLIDSVEVVKEIEPKKYYVGLKNLGSTCYMNSVLQVLFCVQQFKNLVLSLPQPNVQKTEVKGKQIFDNTLYQLQKMYTNLVNSCKKYYNTQQFCLTIKNGAEPIDPKQQEDAHQFVSKFLDKLEKQFQKTDKIDLFRSLLEGNTVTQVLCKKCSNKIHREQKFSQISLAVKDLNNLQESFEKYILPEEIEDYFCSNCNAKVQKIEKSTFISKLPKLLTINLQRIIYDLQTFQNKKIDSNFAFPEDLNIYNYVLKQSNLSSEQCEYKLKAVIVHSGTSLSGHYYSIIRVGDKWFKFNDQTVTKIQFKDIPHECFGGSQSKQQWGDDLKFSINAYILFYENQSIKLNETQFQLSDNFVKSIQSENQKFYRQLQIHQQSVFTFANEVFERFVPKDLDNKMVYKNHEENWRSDPYLEYYIAIYQFHIRLLKFSTVFYDVKSDVVFKIGQNLFKLFYLLPENTYQFLGDLTPSRCIQVLCLHNDETIRNIYKHLLNKSIHVFIAYYQVSFTSEQQGIKHLLTILDALVAYIHDERFETNINKTWHYFEFWKISCEFIPQIVDYLIQKQMIVHLVDRLMGSDSPLLNMQQKSITNEQQQKGQQKNTNKNKNKRSEIPLFCSAPIMTLLLFLTSRKKNLKDYINPTKMFQHLKYYQLSQKQKILLSNINFYQKMIEKRYDNGQLGVLAAKISQKDEQFSKQIACMYIKGLNNITYLETGLAILQHLKYYLSLDDQFTEKRIKWILGIAQLRMGDEHVYGLTYEDESMAYQYVSPLIFVKPEKDHFEPALAIMYEKNNSTFNIFSVEGVSLLLNLMYHSQKIFKYVMGLPAPTYLYRSYLDWIDKFISNFKQNYAFIEMQRPDKYQMHNKLVQLYNFLVEKVFTQDIQLPTTKKIIGRNKQLNAIQSIYTQQYKITLWSHLTYILPNLPEQNSNKSLPKQLFKFANPSGFAKYFISINQSQPIQPTDQIASQLTTYTLEVDAKQLLQIQFKFHQFQQRIRVFKGKVFINFPYEPIQGKITDYIDIFVTKQEPKKMQQVQKVEKEDMDSFKKDMMDYNSFESLLEIECKKCTFLNSSDRRFCEICEELLL